MSDIGDKIEAGCSKIKTVKRKFVSFENEAAQDPSVSFAALGLLAYCLSMPEDWVFRPKLIAKQRGIGRDKCYGLFDEIIEAGYCIRIHQNNPKFPTLSGRKDYVMFDERRSCQAYVSELEQTGQKFDCREDFKKSFRRPEIRCPENRDPEKEDVSKKLDPNKENKTSVAEESSSEDRADLQRTPLPSVPKEKKKPGTKKNDRPKMTKEQEEIYQWLEKKNIPGTQSAWDYWARTYHPGMISEAVHFYEAELKRGVNVHNPGGFIRDTLDGLIIPKVGLRAKNAEVAKAMKALNDWHSLDIGKKYCGDGDNEVSLDLPHEAFKIALDQMFDRFNERRHQ